MLHNPQILNCYRRRAINFPNKMKNYKQNFVRGNGGKCDNKHTKNAT